jgi:hypothetical protein
MFFDLQSLTVSFVLFPSTKRKLLTYATNIYKLYRVIQVISVVMMASSQNLPDSARSANLQTE